MKEINEAGGVADRPVVHLPAEFDIADRSSLTRAIDSLVASEVDAIAFGYTQARDDFAAAFGTAVDLGCPVLHSSTSLSAHQLVQGQPDRFGNVFQVCALESRYGSGFVRFLGDLAASGQWRPVNRRLLIADSSDPNLATFPASAVDAAERAGWQVERMAVDFLAPDWAPVLSRLTASEPAAVMVATWVEESLLAFLRAFRAAAPPTLVYALYAPSIAGFVDRAGPLAEGLLWSTVAGLYRDTLGENFARRFAATRHSDPGRSGAALHYDMVNLLGQAWRQTPNPHDHAGVARLLRGMVHRGVTGVYYFGNEGQSALTYPDDTRDPSLAQAHLVHQIQSGRHVIVAPDAYRTGSARPPDWLPPEARSRWNPAP